MVISAVARAAARILAKAAIAKGSRGKKALKKVRKGVEKSRVGKAVDSAILYPFVRQSPKHRIGKHGPDHLGIIRKDRKLSMDVIVTAQRYKMKIPGVQLEKASDKVQKFQRKYVPPPRDKKYGLQDKELKRVDPFDKKDRLRRDLSWDPSLSAHLSWQGPTRPGALFQRTLKPKAGSLKKKGLEIRKLDVKKAKKKKSSPNVHPEDEPLSKKEAALLYGTLGGITGGLAVTTDWSNVGKMHDEWVVSLHKKKERIEGLFKDI